MRGAVPAFPRDFAEKADLGNAFPVSPSKLQFTETSLLYHRKLDDLPIWLQGGALFRLRQGSPSYGGSLLGFGRVPYIQLRIYAQLEGYTQNLQNNNAFSFAFHSYLERSFPVVPHFFILPRFAFNATYQSLAAATYEADPDHPSTTIDGQVYNDYSASHRMGMYGQLLLWWVPFINMISYAQARVISNQSIRQLDAVSVRAGFDLSIHLTELSAYYEFAQLFVDDARQRMLQAHHLAGQLQETVWVHRNHRLGLWLWGATEFVSHRTTLQLGLFWEGSPSRGLDDYSTPVINLPQQLGRGRGIPKPEETLR
jgi:hypothetical protein